MATARLNRELKELTSNPPDMVSAQPQEGLFHWTGTIEGPEGTPYEDGIFFLDIKFPADYPGKPPKVKFTTKIYHCNINEKGEICLPIIKDEWTPQKTIAQVLVAILTLMEAPNPQSPLMPDIGALYLKDKDAHDKKAASYTEKFAM